MAFTKTSVGITPVKTTQLPIAVGTQKDNLFWTGIKWVTKEEFEQLTEGKKNG